MTEQKNVSPILSRCLPFAVFMMFIGFDEFMRYLALHGVIVLGDTTLAWLYPVKAVVVAWLLYHYRREYRELVFKDLANIPTTVAVCAVGLLTFLLWINMDWAPGVAAPLPGFNPTLFPGKTVPIVMGLFRVCGAVLVVPLMEELFWRSFVIRYIMDKDFLRVPVGALTLSSFLTVTVLFGLEHTFILAGMMAGAMYNLVLYRTRSIAQCTLAHAVTNLALALYVLATGKWYFW